MFGPQRGHFIIILDNFLKDFLLAIIGIVVLIIGSVSMEDMANELFVLAIVFITPIAKVTKHLTTKYEINEHSLIIYTGLFNKKTTEIHKSTISTVDISQTLLQQMLGVSKLKVDNSAQGAEAEAVMAFKNDIALQVKSLLVGEESENVEIKTVNKVADKVKINPSAFVALGLLQSKLGFFVKIYVAITFFSPFLSGLFPNFGDEVIAFIEQYLPTDEIGSEKFLTAIFMVLVLFTVIFIVGYIISLIWSMISTLITFYDFTLFEKDKKLHISYGLLKKRVFTIPKHKICGINLNQSLLMRVMGVYRVDIYAIGYGGASDGEVEQTIFYPLGKKDAVNRVIEQFLPEFSIPTDYISPEKKALRYFFYNFWFIVLSIGLIVSIVLTNPYATVICGVLEIITVIYIILSYKVTGMNITDTTVTFVSGGYSKRTTIVPTDRIESIQAKTTILKKKRGICHINLSYFAPKVVANLNVKNMPLKEFENLEQVLKL